MDGYVFDRPAVGVEFERVGYGTGVLVVFEDADHAVHSCRSKFLIRYPFCALQTGDAPAIVGWLACSEDISRHIPDS